MAGLRSACSVATITVYGNSSGRRDFTSRDAPTPGYILHMAANLFIGGWRLPLSAVLFVAAPVLRSVFLQRRSRLARGATEATRS